MVKFGKALVAALLTPTWAQDSELGDCPEFARRCCSDCPSSRLCRSNGGCFTEEYTGCQVPLCPPGLPRPSSSRRRSSSGSGSSSNRRRSARRRDAPAVPQFVYTKPEGALVFSVIGDWGGSSDHRPTTGCQTSVAEGMGTVSQIMGAEFVLGLGDNFYPSGVHEHNYWRINQTFDDVYSASSLQVPWYNCAGNHDWAGREASVQHQIELSLLSDRWVMPSALYTFTKTMASGKTAKFVMFDHLMLKKHFVYEPLQTRLHTAKMEGVEWDDHSITDRDAGWAWLEQELANSQDDYLFVIDHHPVFTVCSHGNTEELEGLPALMSRYGVTAFFSGHDHCNVHSRKDGISYILVGAASQSWNDNRNEETLAELGVEVQFAIHRHNKEHVRGAFATVELTDTQMTVRHHGSGGELLSEIKDLQPRSASTVV